MSTGPESVPARRAALGAGVRGGLAVATLAGVCALAGAPHAARALDAALRAGGTGSALGAMALLGRAFERAGEARLELVPNLGSSGALKALSAGAIDVAFVSRPLSPGELAAGLQAREYGRTPFVLVTSRVEPAGLSRERIADMLAGRVAAWPDGRPVRFVLRPDSDVDTALLASMSPAIARALEAARTRPGMNIAATDQDAADAAERIPGAIATCTLALVVSEGRRLHPMPIDGVAPSTRTLADGAYPYQKRMYAVVGASPSAAARRFVEFLGTREARAILESHGHALPP